MPEKKEDSPKALQTKRLLAAQLMGLLETQSFKKVTVHDICQRALISRSTFYLHFEDKYDLLRYCIEKELQCWEAAVQSSDIDSFLIFTLRTLLEKKRFYANTLASDPDRELVELFQKPFSRFFARHIASLQQKGRKLPGSVSIVSAFYAGGIVCANIQWIQNGFDISIEEMAACQKQLLSALADSYIT